MGDSPMVSYDEQIGCCQGQLETLQRHLRQQGRNSLTDQHWLYQIISETHTVCDATSFDTKHGCATDSYLYVLLEGADGKSIVTLLRTAWSTGPPCRRR